MVIISFNGYLTELKTKRFLNVQLNNILQSGHGKNSVQISTVKYINK